MRVIRAEFMGLCFGVRDALAIASQTNDPGSVTIYGELVHNPSIQEELASRGFQVVGEQDRERVELTDRVMITAHGISQKRMAILSSRSTEIIDTTCPLVRRVHEATQKLQLENRLVILIGRRNHVEVQGIVEDLSRCIIVESPEQIIDWEEPALGVVSQSTTTPELAQRCLTRILERNANADVRYVDTICRPTRQRQKALEALCQSVALIVVVGGIHSNNTRQLAQRCTELGCKAIQVESAEELRGEWFSGHAVVGLTAGTSTPDATIEEVAKWLTAISERRNGLSNPQVPFGQRWLNYFKENLSVETSLPWSDSPTLSEVERNAVARSIQIFQLGETGSGRHFLKRSQEWGLANSDPHYHLAACHFIAKQQFQTSKPKRKDIMGLQIIGGLAKDSAEARSGLAQYQAKLSEFNEKNAALTPAEERDKKHAMDRIEELEHKMDQIEAADAMVAKFAPQFEERMASMAETPPRARNKVPARAISKTTTSFESNQAAYDAGRWVQAVLLGDPSAKQHCMDRGILNSMSGGDTQKGEILFLKSWKTALLNRGNPLV